MKSDASACCRRSETQLHCSNFKFIVRQALDKLGDEKPLDLFGDGSATKKVEALGDGAKFLRGTDCFAQSAFRTVL